MSRFWRVFLAASLALAVPLALSNLGCRGQVAAALGWLFWAPAFCLFLFLVYLFPFGGLSLGILLVLAAGGRWPVRRVDWLLFFLPLFLWPFFL